MAESASSSRELLFCAYCGGGLEERHLEGRLRKQCPDCGRINYRNPIPAVAMLVTGELDQVMLVRRTVPPEIGHWCLPGGFIEMGETPKQAVHRELMEETKLQCTIDRLFDVGTVINGYYGDVIVLAYVITITGGDSIPGDDVDQIGYFPVTGLPRLAFRCHMEFIERLFDVRVGQDPEH
jgi:ADP-ribose pyrophosphatase YjhB (NUDIX family)